MLDPISAFVLAMLLWAAIIAYTFYRTALERRDRLKPKSPPDRES